MTDITCTTSSNLRLPVTTAPSIYYNGLKEALTECCTPFKEAVAHDCVAIAQSFTLREDNPVYADPIDTYIEATHSPDSYQKRRFDDANRTVLNKIAPGVLLAQTAAIRETILSETIDHMNTNRIQCVMTPDFLLAVNEHHYSVVHHAHAADRPIDQGVIDRCFLIILPQAIESAHHAIELQPLATHITGLVNSAYPVFEKGFNDEKIPVGPPDLSAAFST
jgi:hypothetical protein